MTSQKLVEDNMNLVYWLISKEYSTYIKDEDLIQCGMLGLCIAAEKYDESKGKFSTFAVQGIRNEIRSEFRRRNRHQGVWSLDYEVNGQNGEKTTFGDYVVGDEDVLYIDYCDEQLSPLQRNIVTLLKQGKSTKEIAETLGTTVQNVQWTKRKIRILRRLDSRKG